MILGSVALRETQSFCIFRNESTSQPCTYSFGEPFQRDRKPSFLSFLQPSLPSSSYSDLISSLWEPECGFRLSDLSRGEGRKAKGSPLLNWNCHEFPLPSFLHPASSRRQRVFFSTVSSPPPTPPKKRFLKLRPRRARRSPLKLLTRLVDDVDAAGGRSGRKW